MSKDISLLTNSYTEEKWTFDKTFLVESVKQGKEKLNSGNLSRRKKKILKSDIETFERYINDNYEPETERNLSFPKNIDKLKDYILTRMIKQYKMLGEEIIRWTISLSEQGIFESGKGLGWEMTELSLDEQAELTLKNYEKNSSRFLMPAKSIILDNSIRQIQSVDCYPSYCHHDSITAQSYLIINSLDEPCIFNHEVQHGIEVMLKYLTNPLYYELGPFFYEMLFNEELYKSRGCLKPKDFDFRIEEIEYLLDIVCSYFQVMLVFKEKNFNISTDEFLKTFIEIKNIKPILLEDYLKEEIANDDIVSDMCYLFSFLKSIELREKKISSYNKQSELLEQYLKRKTFDFRMPQDGFKVYGRYLEEMNQKVMRKTR